MQVALYKHPTFTFTFTVWVANLRVIRYVQT